MGRVLFVEELGPERVSCLGTRNGDLGRVVILEIERATERVPYEKELFQHRSRCVYTR